jgi:hypothetical protein
MAGASRDFLANFQGRVEPFLGVRACGFAGLLGFAMRDPPNPADIAEIYIDESSQTNHHYLVLGCIATMILDRSTLNALLIKARLPELPEGEAKWTKVSKRKLPAYKRIVDVLLGDPEIAHFHCLVVDTTRVDHTHFNAGSREIGFNKEIYQLAMKCAQRLYPDVLFHVYPDRREASQKPEDLRLILNRGCRKKADKRDWPFRRCQFRDSKNTLPLQLADIITGALAYKLNGHDRKKDASPSKSELASYVLEHAGVADPFKNTAVVGRFTIWHRKLKRGVSQP